MRNIAAIAVLIIGVLALGWWGSVDHAPDMEEDVTAGANALVVPTTHPIDVSVAGRDITVTGIADSDEELALIKDAFKDVEGLRKVHDDLEVLERGEPFVAGASADMGDVSFEGMVPTEAVRAELATATGVDTSALNLRSGAPDGWGEAAAVALNVSKMLRSGDMVLSGTELSISGEVEDDAVSESAHAALRDLPEGYTSEANFTLRPDLNLLSWNTVEGTTNAVAEIDGSLVTGRLGGTVDSLGAADTQLADTTTTLGDVDARLAALGAWSSVIDGVDLSLRQTVVTVAAGVDPTAVAVGLEEGFGDMDYLVVAAEGQDGDTRENAVTGQSERFAFGNWLPVMDFDPSLENCAQASADVQAGSKVNFVTGTAVLDARATRAVNGFAAVIGHCFANADLAVELAGHTDSTGDPAANLVLSQQRAEAVLTALSTRGVDASRVTATGYGDAQPIADNGTPEGQAANRRTELNWSQGTPAPAPQPAQPAQPETANNT